MPVKQLESYKEGSDRFYRGNLSLDMRPLSVTTALDTLGKGGLTSWAARVVAEKAIKVIGEILKTVGDKWDKDDGKGLYEALQVEKDGLDDLYESLRVTPDTIARESGRVGTAVHAYAEKRLRGKLESGAWEKIPDKKVKSRCHMVDNWIDDYEIQPLFIEGTVYHNVFSYAGRFDLIALVDGVPTIIDFKTGKRIYPETALQLAAYANAEVVKDGNGDKVPMPSVVRGAVLHIKARSYQYLEVDICGGIFATFLKILNLKRTWVNHFSKDVILGVIEPTKK